MGAGSRRLTLPQRAGFVALAVVLPWAWERLRSLVPVRALHACTSMLPLIVSLHVQQGSPRWVWLERLADIGAAASIMNHMVFLAAGYPHTITERMLRLRTVRCQRSELVPPSLLTHTPPSCAAHVALHAGRRYRNDAEPLLLGPASALGGAPSEWSHEFLHQCCGFPRVHCGLHHGFEQDTALFWLTVAHAPAALRALARWWRQSRSPLAAVRVAQQGAACVLCEGAATVLLRARARVREWHTPIYLGSRRCRSHSRAAAPLLATTAWLCMQLPPPPLPNRPRACRCGGGIAASLPPAHMRAQCAVQLPSVRCTPTRVLLGTTWRNSAQTAAGMMKGGGGTWNVALCMTKTSVVDAPVDRTLHQHLMHSTPRKKSS